MKAGIWINMGKKKKDARQTEIPGIEPAGGANVGASPAERISVSMESVVSHMVKGKHLWYVNPIGYRLRGTTKDGYLDARVPKDRVDKLLARGVIEVWGRQGGHIMYRLVEDYEKRLNEPIKRRKKL